MSAVSDNDIERMIGRLIVAVEGKTADSIITMLRSLRDERRGLKAERDTERSRAESLADQVRRDYEQIASVFAERDELHELTDSGRWYSQQTMAAVVAERDALAKDAARYRHLRDCAGNYIMHRLIDEYRPGEWDRMVDEDMAAAPRMEGSE